MTDCQYPDLGPHTCQHVPTENHLAAWHTLSVRLHWHLDRNHQITPSSNRADWSTQHVIAHETDPTPLEIHPANHTPAIRDQMLR